MERERPDPDVDPSTVTRSKFEHDWAENFTLLRHTAPAGLAHYECVRIGQP